MKTNLTVLLGLLATIPLQATTPTATTIETNNSVKVIQVYNPTQNSLSTRRLLTVPKLLSDAPDASIKLSKLLNPTNCEGVKVSIPIEKMYHTYTVVDDAWAASLIINASGIESPGTDANPNLKAGQTFWLEGLKTTAYLVANTAGETPAITLVEGEYHLIGFTHEDTIKLVDTTGTYPALRTAMELANVHSCSITIPNETDMENSTYLLTRGEGNVYTWRQRKMLEDGSSETITVSDLSLEACRAIWIYVNN